MTFEWPLAGQNMPDAPDGDWIAAASRKITPTEAADPVDQTICFTSGTQLATTRGARPVDELYIGDLVVTRDHGLQPIRWIGQRKVAGRGRLAPIRFAAGVLNGLERPLSVSPQHRILLRSPRAELYFGETEVLVPALHFTGATGVTQDPVEEVTYFHILFDHHEIVYAEGTPTESFHPGDAAISALTAPVREELFSLFPQLRSIAPSGGRMARRCLRRHEAATLLPPAPVQPSQLR